MKTGVSNFAKRQGFRDAYAKFANGNFSIRFGLVFTLGMPRTQEDNRFERGGEIVQLTNGGGQFLNPESLRSIRNNFSQEMQQHNDMIVGDYEDTYFNLTLKMTHTYQWAATFCRHHRPTFLFMDDDNEINLNRLSNLFATEPKTELEHMLHGKILNPEVNRFGLMFPLNYQVTKVAWPLHVRWI